MAIRFRCVACSQPIEVDDDWAAKVVACPYCRRTMAVPNESTFGDPSEVPMARPLGDASFPSSWPATEPRAAMLPAAETNRPAAASLILAGSAILLYLASGLIMAPHQAELYEFRKAAEQKTSVVEAAQRLLEAHGGTLPAWLVGAVAMQLSAVAILVASVICGILGLRRAYHRGMAVTGLVLSGSSFLILLCVNVAGLVAFGAVAVSTPVGFRGNSNAVGACAAAVVDTERSDATFRHGRV